MSNHKLIFYGVADTQEHELQCFLNSDEKIYISVFMGEPYPESYIILDKSTAIKFAKTLRTEINKIEE